MDIYTECVKRGIEVDNHESDLYVPVNEVTEELVSGYEFKSNVSKFFNQVTKTVYFEIPFAFLPFWEKRWVNGN